MYIPHNYRIRLRRRRRNVPGNYAGPRRSRQVHPESGEDAVDFSRDFFGKPANLTVSGQLEAETYATAVSRVYTFGPTFRAEGIPPGISPSSG